MKLSEEKTMTRCNWFEKLTEQLEGEFEYRFEKLVMNITEDICRRMVSLKINRAKLAQNLDVSPAAVTKILNGNSNFTLRSLLSLSDALDTDLQIEFRVNSIEATDKMLNARASLGRESQFDTAEGYSLDPFVFNVQKQNYMYAGAGSPGLFIASTAQ
jgi:transcriptional regulator with XRE-family HTH domain